VVIAPLAAPSVSLASRSAPSPHPRQVERIEDYDRTVRTLRILRGCPTRQLAAQICLARGRGCGAAAKFSRIEAMIQFHLQDRCWLFGRFILKSRLFCVPLFSPLEIICEPDGFDGGENNQESFQMKAACVALAATLAMATAIPAEAGSRGGHGGGHGGYGYGNSYGKHGGKGSSGPVIGAKAGAQVAAKLNVLNIVKVKAGVGLGLGLGLLGGR
jgi:hypothetical protein